MRAIPSTTRISKRVYEFLTLNSKFLIAPLLLAASPVSVMPAAQGATAGELKAKFEHRLSDIAANVDGVVGYEIVDLTSGDRFAHLERDTFPTASTIKLTLVYELFKQAEEGRIRLDETLALDRSKAVGGTGVLVEMGTPVLSIRDYAVLMVTLSDNSATNVLIAGCRRSASTERSCGGT
jgi:beta-lactamase class A